MNKLIVEITGRSDGFLGFLSHGRNLCRHGGEIWRVGERAQIVDGLDQRLGGGGAVVAVGLAVVLVERLDLFDQPRRRVGHVLGRLDKVKNHYGDEKEEKNREAEKKSVESN